MRILKSAAEIDRLFRAGQVVAAAHRLVANMLRPGVRTGELNAVVEAFFEARGAEAVFKEYCPLGAGRPFPTAISTSINEEVIGGVPGQRVLCEEDLVTIDLACRLDGWCADAAWTYSIGEVGESRRRLLAAGEDALLAGIDRLRDGSTWRDVAERIDLVARRSGFTAVGELAGHGIGRELHEDPQLPYWGSRFSERTPIDLEAGLVLAIEPVLTMGSGCLRGAGDYGRLITRDGQPSVHFEHTVALSESGPVILTAGVGDCG